MRTECTDYMYDCKWTIDFLERSVSDYHSDAVSVMKQVEDVTILPQRDAEGHSWGIGGAVTSEGTIVEESKIGAVFGGYYPVSQTDIQNCPFSVYYIPIIPRHWGHFLLDVLSRFWFMTDGSDQGYPIAFCGKDFPDGVLSGNYMELLNALGIAKDRLIYVNQPMHFERVLIPEAAYGDGKPYNDQYLKIINTLKQTVLASDIIKEQKPVEKIYFTRTRFRRAKMTEVGEKEIEALFQKNGFLVLAPEELSFAEQVFYFSTAKEIASISGTISHNIMFCESGTNVTILNRCCLPNQAQFSVNQMSPANVIYVDCFAKETMRSPQYWPVWVEVNKNLMHFLHDKGYVEGSYSTIELAAFKGKNLLSYKLLKSKMKLKALLRR